MGIPASFLKKISIIVIVIVIGLALGLWRQLHNGWVWYYFLSQNTNGESVFIVDNYLSLDALEETLETINFLPDISREIVQSSSQYGFVTVQGQATRLLVKDSIAQSQKIENNFQQYGLHTVRWGGFVLAQQEPISKSKIIKNIALNIGKNYLTKKPFLLAEVPPMTVGLESPTVVVIEPYQAGIKAYLGLNKEEIRKEDRIKVKQLKPLPQNDYSVGLITGKQINNLPHPLKNKIDKHLHQLLGFAHTQPDLLSVFSESTQVAMVARNSTIAIAAETTGGKAASMLLGYLNKEEAYAHPVTQSFSLPDGRSGQEIIPNYSQEYFTAPPTGCQGIYGQAIHTVLCQSDTGITIGTTQHVAQLAQEALRQSEVDWQLDFYYDPQQSLLPQLNDWNRLSAYQKGLDIVFFLEK